MKNITNLTNGFTSGQWKVDEIDPSQEEIFISNEEKTIAIALSGYSKNMMEDEEAEANARLIVEAKNMYYSLKYIYKCLNLEYKGQPMPPDKDLENIKAIINRINNK